MKNEKRSTRLNCWNWLESIRELASRTAPSIDPSRRRHPRHRSPPWAASPAIISSKLSATISYALKEFQNLLLNFAVEASKIKFLVWVQLSHLFLFGARPLTYSNRRRSIVRDGIERKLAMWKILSRKRKSVPWTFLPNRFTSRGPI